MRKLLLGVVILTGFLFFTSESFAQAAKHGSPNASDQNTMTAGLGMTWIDGQPYYLVNIAPELAFGKFGVGLDLNLYVSSKDQSIRWAELQRGRFIRYLRWGQKGDDVYARVGVLDYAQLGHGSIMYLYRNSPSFDDRRLGAEFDLDFGKTGFETVYGDFTEPGVFGIRGYVRPLQYTTLAPVPIIGGLEIGATWAGDYRKDSRDTSVNWMLQSVGPPIPQKENLGTMNILGADLGLPLLRVPMVSSTLYFDYAKIIHFGSGEALGLQTDFSGLGIFNILTKFERRWQGDHYLPDYFDAFYELDRYQLNSTSFSSKAQTLNQLVSPGPGYFGDLTIAILGRLQVRGTYSKLDHDPKSGVLHLGASTGNMLPVIVLDAGYDKKYIQNNKDVFTLDNRSLLYASVGYKPYPFMIVSMLYTWTFAPVTDTNGNTSYVTQKRVEPKVSIVFPL
jgi:hypothetical protein